MLNNYLWYQLHLPWIPTEFGDACLEKEGISADTQSWSGLGEGEEKTEDKEVPVFHYFPAVQIRRKRSVSFSGEK